MKKLQIILESSGDELYGRIESIEDFMPVTSGKNIQEVEMNLRDLIKDHQENDDPDGWTKVNVDKVEFTHTYDLTAFSTEFDFINISKVAAASGLNAALLRQYTSGVKHPSAEQAKKIESTVRELGKRLSTVHLFGAAKS